MTTDKSQAIPDGVIIETFKSVVWKDFPNAPGVQYIDVEGSITKAGPFLARVRFPGGTDTVPHAHNAPFVDRNTVISGTYTSRGKVGSGLRLRR